MKNLICLFFFISFFSFSQEEKRLALVIGNSNYDKGELKNPVNDARLIASTLDSLDFDVILKENIETRTGFIRAIREFGTKRPEYDVAFVYYAGHGIQVDDENFLLPTKEEFSSEEDVLDFAVSVQNVMRYLKSQTDEVNILILDACRDNPFESTWNTTRSLKGQGLAKIPPPTGSLIAFSTDSGQTALDGDGENSIYSISLAKNMLLEDTSIDQVFRNVRSEVLHQTNQAQRPVEATQLTGKGFVLKPINLLQIASDYYNNSHYEEALNTYQNAFKDNPKLKNNAMILTNMGTVYSDLGSIDKAIEYYTSSIEIDSSYLLAYSNRSYEYTNLKMYNEAEADFNAVIDLAPNNPNSFTNRAAYFHWIGENNKALMDYKKAYEIDIKDKQVLLQIAIEYQLTNQFEKAIETYLEYLKFYPTAKGINNNLAIIYSNLDEHKKALIYINKEFKLDASPGNYTVRGSIYLDLGNLLENNDLNYYDKSLQDLTKAIELGKNKYDDIVDADDSELKISKGLSIYQALYEARIQFFISTNQYELAINDINVSIKLDNFNPDNYYKLFYIFKEQGKYFDAYLHINNCIDKAEIADRPFRIYTLGYDEINMIDLYLLRADISKKINNYNGSCQDYNIAIGLADEHSESFNDIQKLISENCDSE